MDRTELGKRVRAARAYGGWTRAEDLAAAVGMGRTTLLKTEKGERDPKHWELIAIAELCGLPRDFFTADWGNGSPMDADEVIDEAVSERAGDVVGAAREPLPEPETGRGESDARETRREAG